MKMLLASGLDIDPNIDAACIGNLPRMQLMCKTEEGNTKGLGILT
jgi:hypothetical protein